MKIQVDEETTRATNKAARLAVQALIKLSGVEEPRQVDLARLFGVSTSNVNRDQDDAKQTVALLTQILSQPEIAALIRAARSTNQTKGIQV